MKIKKKKEKVKKRPKENLRLRQEENCHITLIRDGRIIIDTTEVEKK